MKRVTRQEWLWAIVVAGLITAFSTVPYAVGYVAQTPESRFGGAVIDQADYHSHLAKMWQGYRGNWRYRLLFTPEDHRGAYLQTFYVVLGHLARITGLALPVVYQVARIGFGAVMLLTIYRFIAHFLTSVRVRRMAFVLATVASGLGWIPELLAPTLPGGISPMSFWLLDAYVYLSLLAFPHFCAATTLLLIVFLALLDEEQGPSLRNVILASVLSIGLGLIHPYMLLVVDAVPILYWIVGGLGGGRSRRGMLAVGSMGLLQSPLLLYDIWVFRRESVFAAWSAQNVTLSPPIGVYLWGYGLLLVLGAVGALVQVRRDRFPASAIGRRRHDVTFLLLWIGVVALLTHLPWRLQRRFLEGVQVPLGALAAMGLVHVRGRLNLVGLARLLPGVLVGLATVSNLYMTTGLALGAAQRQPELFLHQDVLAAVDWLGERASWEETVLSSPHTGELIPARIGQRVVIGHRMETIDYSEKKDEVASFFSAGSSKSHRLDLIEEWGVRWVFYGPEEQRLGSLDASSLSWLKPVLESPTVTIYAVSPEAVE